MEEKRKRTINFTSDEKSVLTELVVKYKEIIENKKTDASTNAEKTRGWKSLCEEFNALSTYCIRNPESLKICWENIKRQTKKQSANRKRELFKTGGGRPQPPPCSTGADRLVEDVLGPALEGLENVYDSDALLYINDTDKDATKLATNGNTQLDSDTFDSEEAPILVVESEPSCSSSFPIPEISEENKNNDLKWEGWTPKSLKRPISEILRTSNGENKENNSWLKRRRPEQRNLNDQLILEKIDLVKTLKQNAYEESKKKILILDEQLKQERIKTQKLL